MAGKPGRSGGARPNSGPKPRTLPQQASQQGDPLEFLISVMNDVAAPAALRVKAAVAACSYTHAKKGESGKRDERTAKAGKANAGRFSATSPPRLVVNN